MTCLLNPTHFNLELFNQAKNVPEVLQSSQGSTEFPRFYRVPEVLQSSQGSTELSRFYRVPQSKFEENRPRDSWVMIGHTNKHTEIRTLFNLKLCVNILFTSFILKYLVFSLYELSSKNPKNRATPIKICIKQIPLQKWNFSLLFNVWH